MIKAALIDMDGVLYDSMPFHAKAWKKLTDEMGMDIDEQEFYLYEGMTGEATIKELGKRELGKDFSKEECAELYNKKTQYFRECGKAVVMPGARQLLNWLTNNGIKCVLVTGSGQMSLINKLTQDFPGVFKNDLLVTSHNVSHGKPHPEPYLKGAALAKVHPNECIAIDNAPLGVKSASEAGTFTIGVTTGPIPASTLKKAGAIKIVGSMKSCLEFIKTIIDQ